MLESFGVLEEPALEDETDAVLGDIQLLQGVRSEESCLGELGLEGAHGLQRLDGDRVHGRVNALHLDRDRVRWRCWHFTH